MHDQNIQHSWSFYQKPLKAIINYNLVQSVQSSYRVGGRPLQSADRPS